MQTADVNQIAIVKKKKIQLIDIICYALNVTYKM